MQVQALQEQKAASKDEVLLKAQVGPDLEAKADKVLPTVEPADADLQQAVIFWG